MADQQDSDWIWSPDHGDYYRWIYKNGVRTIEWGRKVIQDPERTTPRTQTSYTTQTQPSSQPHGYSSASSPQPTAPHLIHSPIPANTSQPSPFTQPNTYTQPSTNAYSDPAPANTWPSNAYPNSSYPAPGGQQPSGYRTTPANNQIGGNYGSGSSRGSHTPHTSTDASDQASPYSNYGGSSRRG